MDARTGSPEADTDDDLGAYTVAYFIDVLYPQCKASFYKGIKAGRGPEIVKIGARTFITRPAVRKYQERLEAEAAARAAAAKAAAAPSIEAKAADKGKARTQPDPGVPEPEPTPKGRPRIAERHARRAPGSRPTASRF